MLQEECDSAFTGSHSPQLVAGGHHSGDLEMPHDTRRSREVQYLHLRTVPQLGQPVIGQHAAAGHSQPLQLRAGGHQHRQILAERLRITQVKPAQLPNSTSGVNS